jgi:hypothetical protein
MAQLTLQFDEDTIREIAALAAEQGMSQSAWLAQEIRTFVAARIHHPAHCTQPTPGQAERPSAEDDQTFVAARIHHPAYWTESTAGQAERSSGEDDQ